MKREKINIALIGGGRDSFIGRVHRKAIENNFLFHLSCGIFSRNAEKNKSTALFYGLSSERAYNNIDLMFSREEIDVVVIATPNHTHFQYAKMALMAGKHVICDKPVTLTVEEAEELARLKQETKKCFAITYTYSGYAMVRKAKDLIAGGAIGRIQKVAVQYFQGWLSEPMEEEWRLNPEYSGLGGALGDIGTHAFQMVENVTGNKVKKVMAKLSSKFAERQLDDNAIIIAELENEKFATIDISQVATGEKNRFQLRVYGNEGALVWSQEEGEKLTFIQQAKEPVIFTDEQPNVSESDSDLPPGHGNSFQLGMNQIYSDVLNQIVESEQKQSQNKPAYPTLEEGLRGMKFIKACVKSNQTQNWINI